MRLKVNNSFLALVVVLIAGCGGRSGEKDDFLTAPPLEIVDPIHQQDIMNLEAPDEDVEQEDVHLKLVEALNKKIDHFKEADFITQEIVPVDAQNESPASRTSYEGRASVYYLPILDEKRNCAVDKRVNMRDPQGNILTQLCRNEVLNCALQGSCYFLKSNEIVLFAYSGHVKVKLPKSDKIIQEPRFKLNQDLKECPFGMGAGKTCLDPYRSVAADNKFHKRGDVIYVPVLDGQVLPNGEIHDGHLIVRDTGGAILGEGRFDFFIGFDDYRGHLFTRLNLSDKDKNFFTYYKVPEVEAQLVRKARHFPSVPGAGKITTLSIIEAQKKLNLAQNGTTAK